MSEEIKDSVFYAGKFSKQLDEKRRITIPAKWRFKGDDAENSYLAMLERIPRCMLHIDGRNVRYGEMA